MMMVVVAHLISGQIVVVKVVRIGAGMNPWVVDVHERVHGE